MIQGKRAQDLNINNILNKVTEYDIFRYYMKQANRSFTLNKATISPFRNEKNPSFIIGNKHGYLYYIDFADCRKRGDCFDFVRELYHISLNKALEMIDNDFSLGIRNKGDTSVLAKIQKEYKQPEEAIAKRNVHIDISDLREENVYSISKLYLNRKPFPLKRDELRFGYLYGTHWKIYRPFSGKKNKWMPNNVPATVLDGVKNLSKEKIAFINKSKKDMMVTKKLYPYSCSVQNENIGCFSKENVEILKNNSSKQILSFDSDAPGVSNSIQITKLFNFDYCNVPRKYLRENIKDWADLAKSYGLDVIKEHLTEKGIY